MNRMQESKKGKGTEIDAHIAACFQQGMEIVQGLSFAPQNVPIKSLDKVTALVDMLRESVAQKECKDCANYESSLQRLENQIRKHIRLEQQLRIFQDSMEEKIEEAKKDKAHFEKKIETQQKLIEELKMSKAEKEPLKPSRDSEANTRRKALIGEAKENQHYWDKGASVHHVVSSKAERKSIEKRADSTQKHRAPSNCRSIRAMPLMNEKMLTDRNREERKKLLQTKLDYRR